MFTWLPTFQFPELFLLAIPLGFVYRRWCSTNGVTGWLRLAILACLLLAMAGPRIDLGGRGMDVVLVADRSRSMPEGSAERVRELVQIVEGSRSQGDRVGVVTFGAGSRIESSLSETAQTDRFIKTVLPDGSDLNDGLLTALNLIDSNRPARILVLSDGESNGVRPESAARRAREDVVPIDFRLFERQRVGDVAIQSVQLPDRVAPREQFQFSVVIDSDRETSGVIELHRDDRKLASRPVDLKIGANVVRFRDVIEKHGFHGYNVRLDVPSDPLTENNIGQGGIRVDGGQRMLVLSGDGSAGNLVAALRAGDLSVDVAQARTHPLTQDSLDAYSAVIIENVPARDLGRLKMGRLVQFAEDRGGGLMLTGGQRSFGTGGYYKSPLEDVLPVSMELREEHRKMRLAIAIALDRSGSMTMAVSGGQTKMDLANLGTAECINLLGRGDSVAVIAVDSTPHVIQPLTTVGEDQQALVAKVKTIESLGGGIFVYEALVAAGQELAKAKQLTRHIILFSDAQDSEQPGNYRELLAQFEKAGITVSVIGLGTDSDTDAELLTDIARRGQGNILFTSDAQELPRLFSEETMSVARSSFVEQDPETQPAGIPGALVPESQGLGDLAVGRLPTVAGYNLCYLKPRATPVAVSHDEFHAPWSAFWRVGLGRAAALTLEVDGQFSGQFGRWDDYADFLVTHARWLMGTGELADVYVSVRREGQDAVVRVELGEEFVGHNSEPPRLFVIQPGAEREEMLQPDLIWTSPSELEGRFPLRRLGTYRTLLQLANEPATPGTTASAADRPAAEADPRFRVTLGPTVSLPYSPEFLPRRHLPSGQQTLAAVAEISRGVERADVTGVFDDPPRSSREVSLMPYLFALSITLLVLEIAGRRLSLWTRAAAAGRDSSDDLQETGVKAPRWMPKVRWKWRSRSRQAAQSQPVDPGPSAAPVPQRSSGSVFAQAKRQARRRIDD